MSLDDPISNVFIFLANLTLLYNFGSSTLYKMRNVRVIRRERFNAAHRLFNPNWSDEKTNKLLENVPTRTGMGTTTSFVTVEGTIDPQTGYVMDLKNLAT